MVAGSCWQLGWSQDWKEGKSTVFGEKDFCKNVSFHIKKIRGNISLDMKMIVPRGCCLLFITPSDFLNLHTRKMLM